MAALLWTMSMSFSAHVRADDASEARARRELGQEHYRAGRYQEALDLFLEAHRLVPLPTLEFDIAQTYALLDRPVQCFNWYRSFLQSSAGSTDLSMARQTAERALAELRSRVALLEVSSSPAGAEVYVDRAELGSWGRTPLVLAVPAGTRTIILRAPGHHEARVGVEAALGTTTTTGAALAPILGRLVLTSTPPGASIEEERTGRVLGQTPLDLVLPIGELRLRARLSGYVDSQRSLDVFEGGTTEIQIAMVREASTVAVLDVDGIPTGATVRVRGETLGSIPFTRADLPPGDASLEVSADGFAPYTTNLLLEAGGATRVHVTLRPPVAWDWPLARGLLYGASGLLCAGAVALGGAALAQRDAFFANPTRGALDAVEPMAIASDVLFAAALALVSVTLAADLLARPPLESSAVVELDR